MKTVKVIDRSKSKKSKSASNRNYTLNCELRIIQFKEEFRKIFDAQLDKNGASFEDHYAHVLSKMAKVTIGDEQRRENLFTQPDVSQHQKGTVIISEADVLNNPMLQLSENQFRQLYGDSKLEIQNLKNLTENDDFIPNLFKNVSQEKSQKPPRPVPKGSKNLNKTQRVY